MLKEINTLETVITQSYLSPYSELQQVPGIMPEDLDNDDDGREDLMLGASALPSLERVMEKRDNEEISTMFLSMLAFCKEWKKMRRTFIIDNDFIDVLNNAQNTKMYLKVFENIKYPCFAFEFDSKIQKYNDIEVVGFIIDIRSCEITEKDVADIISDGREAKEAGKYFCFSIMTVLNGDGETTAAPFSIMLHHKDCREDEYGKYFLFDDMCSYVSPEHIVTPARLCLSLCLAYYLCSKEPDIVENKAVIAQKKKIDKITNLKLKKKKMKEFEYKSEVGTRIGNAIRLNATASTTKEAQTEGEEKSKVSGKTRKMVTPHVRGAHWSHRWHGNKDNKELQPCFIAPTFVNPHLGEIDEVKQAVKV